MKLGILGGSFNPIHHGHLIIATRVAEALSLDRVLLIPAAVSPLKAAAGLAPGSDRWAMVRRAVRGHPILRASDLELRRGGTSYTVDTLRALRRRYAGTLHLIVGADQAGLLPKWRSIEDVARLARLVIVERGGHSSGPKVPKLFKAVTVEVPLLEISSTEIRQRLRQGLSVRYLVPDAVERYLTQRRLYQS